MFDTMYKLTGKIILEQKRLESITSNMANANSPGYRGEHVASKTFAQALDESISKYVKTGFSVGQNKRVTDFSQGATRNTGRSLDFALQGKGFFTAETPDGRTVYTRNGAFKVTPKGNLVTQEGFEVKSERGNLELPDNTSINDVRVKEDGTVYVRTATGTSNIGKLKIVEVDNKANLTRLSPNYFTVPSSAGRSVKKAEGFSVSNFMLETANVSAIMEMSRMIESLRGHEIATKVLKMADNLLDQHQKKLGV